MMCAAMSRRTKLVALLAAIGVAILTSACGTQRITASKTADGGALYRGAVIFSQRCSGCHTLSYAGANGSPGNIRDAQGNSGPNFNIRCERPVDRVLYAIENGGFSGAYMPQNVVVGQDAVDVAKFVATYAGRQAPKIPGAATCQSKKIGSLPPNTNGLSASGSQQASSETSLKVIPGTSTTLAASRSTKSKKHSS
jgi:mono/diheme cytochrome c family protein